MMCVCLPFDGKNEVENGIKSTFFIFLFSLLFFFMPRFHLIVWCLDEVRKKTMLLFNEKKTPLLNGDCERSGRGQKPSDIFFSFPNRKKAPNTHNTNNLAAQCVDICT